VYKVKTEPKKATYSEAGHNKNPPDFARENPADESWVKRQE
jgi:hypothetical protein